MLDNIISDPVFLISSMVQAFTVACVPTGIKAGVLILPLWVSIKPLLDNFLKKKFQILVSTTIIEVGIDFPNANVIIIERSISPL